MKHIKHLFAVCLLLLVATTAAAQSQSDNTQTKAVSATKADVNGDGVVNEADIEEILAIMQQENGTNYYWYTGTTNPSTMTSTSPIVTDTTSPGWRLIGTSIPAYDKANPLWNSDKGVILYGDTKVTAYVAMPSNNIKYRNDITGEDLTSELWESIGSKTINNVNYIIYKSVSTLKRFSQTWY